MSKKSAPKPPPMPNPTQIIAAQEQANRVGQINPFGSATYQTGPNGTNVVTQLSPQMQGLVDRQFNLANTDSQRLETPPQLMDLGAAIGARVGQRYGMGSKPSAQGAMPAPQGMGSGQDWRQAPTQQASPDAMAALQAALARRSINGGG